MNQHVLLVIAIGLFLSSCNVHKAPKSALTNSTWDVEALNQKAMQQLDSSQWDAQLYQQDIETYSKYSEFFQSYPLDKTPFPVAEYDYAVSKVPFTIIENNSVFKGLRIGEFENPDSDKVIEKLTIIVLTNDKDSEENSMVESRNFPYLTAQGYFKAMNNTFDWVFCASPDGFSTLILNMKLFDLRFGETIIIYPKADNSFFYDQIKDSPNNYDNFEDYKASILKHAHFRF